MMRESRLYLNFFKNNLLIIMFCGLVFLVIGIYDYLNSKAIYKFTRVVEYKYEYKKADEVGALVDEKVALLRSKNLEKYLLNDNGKINVYKSGPFSLTYEIITDSKTNMRSYATNVQSYLEPDINARIIHPDLYEKLPNLKIYYIPIYLILGYIFGIFISLIKSYFEKY